jgi:hypothetical protein
MITRTPRGVKSTRKEIEKYLNENGIPYLKIEDSLNLVMLKKSKSSHYCTIEFLEISEDWFNKYKPFEFKRIISRKAYQIKELIKKYLKDD